MTFFYLIYSEETSDCIVGYFKTSCKTGEGIEEMFNTVATSLSTQVKSRHDLMHLDEASFQVTPATEEASVEDDCVC